MRIVGGVCAAAQITASRDAGVSSVTQLAGPSAMDSVYAYNPEELKQAQDAKPWTADAKFFDTALISATAAAKMLDHSVSGVNKGIAKNGVPVEVMGLLLGRIAVASDFSSATSQLAKTLDFRKTMIVTDVFPLPIEGAETKVLADDDEVIKHMIDLSETVFQVRDERFCGWYHSHPFDVCEHSQSFLSSTDVSTQLQWQRAEDPQGNPWLAVVVDPLRSLKFGQPEIGAFRAFPPEFVQTENETPDGSVDSDKERRTERWGHAADRYHTLNVLYFQSDLAKHTLEAISAKHLWSQALSASARLEPSARNALATDLMENTVKRMRKAQEVDAAKAAEAATADLEVEAKVSRVQQRVFS